MADNVTTDDTVMDPVSVADPMADGTQTDDERTQIRMLLNATETLSPSERQYWLDLLPTMNDEQMGQLKEILQTEQEKMEAIDQKYDQKMEEVAEKTLNKWDSEKAKVKRMKLLEEEKSHLEEDHESAEALLENW